jgi:hypothetical protein
MNTSKRPAGDDSSRPSADDVVRLRGPQVGSRGHVSEAAREAKQAEQFFDRVSKDKEASVRFLRRAGILDGGGSLAKPYRD